MTQPINPAPPMGDHLIQYHESKLAGKELVIFKYMASNDGINRFEAIRIGDTCLNSTISTLRKKGVNIVSEYEKVPTNHGKDVFVKRYWLAT